MTDNATNIEGILAKNAELLDECKKAKAARNEAEERANALEARVHYFEYDQPINSMAAEVGTLPDYWRAEFEKHWAFTRNDDGGLSVTDKQGQPIIHDFPEGKRAVGFNPADLREFVCASEHADIFERLTIGSKASGGGAAGVISGAAPPKHQEKAPEEPAKPHLGLR